MKHEHNHDQKGNFFYSCEDAKFACDRKQYGELKFFDKIKLLIHLFYCDYCRLYAKRNYKLTSLFKRVGVTQPAKQLDDASKELMRKEFEKELKSI